MRYFFVIFLILFFSETSFSQNSNLNNDYIDLTNNNSKSNNENKKSTFSSNKNEKKNVNIASELNKNNSNIKSKVITRGKLDSPSLGSIGVDTRVNKKFGLNIWDRFTAVEAIKNLNYLPNVISSNVLQHYLIDLYSSISIPPNGNSDEIVKFLETKLLKISSSGHTERLKEIVIQLPNSPRWERWKKWYVEYNLMKKKDKEACKLVKEFLKRNTSIFWQKSNIVCLLTNQKFNEAKFIHDVLLSQNLMENVFTELFDYIIDETNPNKILFEIEKLEPIHIVMLDILKYPISANMVANFDSKYSDALLDLIYIEPEARSFLLDKMIVLKKIKREKIIQIYQSVLNPSQKANQALLNLSEKSNGINRANVWLSSLNMKDDLKKVEYILKVLEIENDLGRIKQSLDLYMPILNSIEIKSLPSKLNKIIDYLKVLHNPNNHLDNDLSKLILSPKKGVWNLDIINKHHAWGYIKYIENSGMLAKDHNWYKLIEKMQSNSKTQNFSYRWSGDESYRSFVIRKAIEQKSNNGDKIHTLLLVGRLLGNESLNNFDLDNLTSIEIALKKIGLEDLAKELRTEVITSKFTNIKIENAN